MTDMPGLNLRNDPFSHDPGLAAYVVENGDDFPRAIPAPVSDEPEAKARGVLQITPAGLSLALFLIAMALIGIGTGWLWGPGAVFLSLGIVILIVAVLIGLQS